MTTKKEAPWVRREVLEIWNYNPKTCNIASGSGLPSHPIFGDTVLSHSLFKICDYTKIGQGAWESWFSHRPIVVYYDVASRKKEYLFSRTTKFKATRIEPLNRE